VTDADNVAAAGALTSMQRQDVLANNLANLETVAFKPDSVLVQQRLPARVEEGALADPREMLERLGGGVHALPTRTSMRQGSIVDTGNPLDVALDGEGFLVVDDPTRPGAFALTRDGRLTRDEGGTLVTASEGRPVLGTDGLPIVIPDGGPVRIDEGGRITRDGAELGRLRIAMPAGGAEDLRRIGHGLFGLAEGAAPLPDRPGAARLRQGATERSAVDPITTLNEMIAAAKAANSNLKMMQFHDYLTGQAVNTFARVS